MNPHPLVVSRLFDEHDLDKPSPPPALPNRCAPSDKLFAQSKRQE
jgi:hypothetical protein